MYDIFWSKGQHKVILNILYTGTWSFLIGILLESLLLEYKAHYLVELDFFFPVTGITSEKCLEVNLSGKRLMLSLPDMVENSSRRISDYPSLYITNPKSAICKNERITRPVLPIQFQSSTTKLAKLPIKTKFSFISSRLTKT